ncbi:endonuclease domain-containing protein [Streptomyces sp. NPDC021012]|uniref:endonuclease domain-containing protein n=1 Tax=Streptomyces sp. NPDC021012 TaxID=3365107 RepID=UPI0037AF6E9A
MRDVKTCHICDAQYIPTGGREWQRYCSRKCASASTNTRKRRDPSLKRCRTCLLDLPVARYELNHHSCRECESLSLAGQKRCKTCASVKPVEAFHARNSRPDGRESSCKACRSERSRIRNADATQREVNRNAKYLARYGLSVAQVEAKLAEQGGKCAICREELTKYVVDHHHGSGKVRDLLCNGCNVVIGHCREKPDVLLAAIHYLERHKP